MVEVLAVCVDSSSCPSKYWWEAIRLYERYKLGADAFLPCTLSSASNGKNINLSHRQGITIIISQSIDLVVGGKDRF